MMDERQTNNSTNIGGSVQLPGQKNFIVKQHNFLLLSNKIKEQCCYRIQTLKKRKNAANLLLIIISVVSLLVLITLSQPENAKAAENNTLTIGELEIGDRVVDKSWTWEHRSGKNYTYKEGDKNKPVTWIVVAKDHYGESSGVTLLSEEVIGKVIFDNSTHIHASGSNHWGNSGTHNSAAYGLRPWLNSYCEKNVTELTSYYIYRYNTSINCMEGGFYNAFSQRFRNSIVETTLPCIENEISYDGIGYCTQDKVFLPSKKELNAGGGNAHPDESVWAYFAEAKDADRIAKVEGTNTWYWTRTPYIVSDHLMRFVHHDGSMQYGSPHNPYRGVRPALNIASDTPVSALANKKGVFSFFYPLGSGCSIEPPHSLPLKPSEKGTIIVTVKDSDENPIAIGKKDEETPVTIKQRNGDLLSDLPWLESVNYDYAYGEANQVQIIVKSEAGLAGKADGLVIQVGDIVITNDYTIEIEGYDMVSKPNVTFNMDSSDDIAVTLTNNGRILQNISDGDKILLENTDYKVDGNVYTIMADYLSGKGEGTITLIFEMDTGVFPTMSITNTSGDADSTTVSPTIVNYPIGSGNDLSITLSSNERNLLTISNGNYEYELVIDTDYTVEGNIFTIKGDYLDKQKIGTTTLIFNMDSGNSPEIEIIVCPRNGDVSGCGDITVSDAILVLRHIVGLINLEDSEVYDENAFNRARVAGKENLTVSDAILILRYIVGLIDKF